MNKFKAHAILAIFDILALFSSYYVFEKWKQVNKFVKNGIDNIVIQNFLGVYLILLIVPITHFIILFKKNNIMKKFGNYFLIISFLLLLIIIFCFNYKLKSYLNNSGYCYSRKDTKIMTFSNFNTYTKKNLTCSD